MAIQNVCRYNQFGYCKFAQACRKYHVDDLCVDSACDLSICMKRHPVECRYFRNYKRCKFSLCKFSHEINDDEKLKELNEKVDRIEDVLKDKTEIELKIKEIDEKLKELDKLETSVIKKTEALENVIPIVENRFEQFESNLSIMKKAFSEKDLNIKRLEERIVDVVKVNEEQSLKI